MSGESFTRVIEKLDWAKEHIEHLNRIADDFRNAHSDAVVREENAQTGEIVYRISYVPEIPSSFAYVLGDVLQNLTSALDYLACELVTSAGQKPSPDTAFPIADSPHGYWERLAPKVKGMRQQAIEEINRFRAYKGGFGHAIWTMNKLNNIAKHRRLLTMAFAQVGSLTPREESQFATEHARINLWRHNGDVSKVMIVIQFGASAVIAKAGHILKTLPPNEAQKDMRFIFDIAVNEPEVESGGIVVPLVGMMTSQVRNIVDSMGPFLN